jgi:hypothetical protein
VTMFTSFDVSEVIGCWFRSISSPSSHSEADKWSCGWSVKRTNSLEELLFGGYP